MALPVSNYTTRQQKHMTTRIKHSLHSHRALYLIVQHNITINLASPMYRRRLLPLATSAAIASKLIRQPSVTFGIDGDDNNNCRDIIALCLRLRLSPPTIHMCSNRLNLDNLDLAGLIGTRVHIVNCHSTGICSHTS